MVISNVPAKLIYLDSWQHFVAGCNPVCGDYDHAFESYNDCVVLWESHFTAIFALWLHIVPAVKVTLMEV